MSRIDELIDVAVSNFKNATFLQATYANIDIDYWTVTLLITPGSPHSLSSTDLESAQAESDAWFLSNGFKRISTWAIDGLTTRSVVAL